MKRSGESCGKDCKGWILLSPSTILGLAPGRQIGRSITKGLLGWGSPTMVLGLTAASQGAYKIENYLFIANMEEGTASTCVFKFLTPGRNITVDFDNYGDKNMASKFHMIMN